MTATNDNAICPRCAKRFAPCEPWRVGCPVCGNILQTATREAVAAAFKRRTDEGWHGDRRIRSRLPL
jgi:predicted amidophosphoribosyltransferase